MTNILKNQGHSWKGMRKDVERFVRSCVTCRRVDWSKNRPQPLIQICADKPWGHVQVDLVTNLPKVGGKTILLVVVDVYSSWCWMKAISTKKGKTVALALLEVFSVMGVPSVLQSDNGREFVNEAMVWLKEKFQLNHRFSTPYHPEANGRVERKNGQILVLLRKMLLEYPSLDWVELLPWVQFCINCSLHERSGLSAFQLMFLRPNKVHVGRLERGKSSEEIWEQIKSMIQEQVWEEYVKRDKRALAQKRLEVGTQVVRKLDRPDKLSPGSSEVLEIVRVSESGAYTLSDGSTVNRNKIQPVG